MTAVDLAPGVHQLTDEQYFAPELARVTLSSTGAKELLKPGGPARFRHQQDAGTVEIKREFDVGHAVHTLVLGSGPALVRIDAEEWRSKAVKEEVAAVREAGCVPMRPQDYDAAHQMAAAVKAHPIAGKLFVGGLPERTLLWPDQATGVLCRAKADWLRPDGIVDLKTTPDAADAALSKSAHAFGYYLQAAFYLRGHRLHADRTVAAVPFFAFVSVERPAPHLVHVWQLTERALAYGDRRVSEALEIYRDCSQSGHWPGYPENEITDIDLPAWVRTEEW